MPPRDRLTRRMVGLQPVVVGLALLMGCATDNASDAANYASAQQKYKDSIPTCSAAKECEAKWIAARRWVLDNADMKLQHNTDDYIETYGGGDSSSPLLFARVTKTPINETDYRIDVELGGNFNIWQRIVLSQQFNDAVNAAWTPAPK